MPIILLTNHYSDKPLDILKKITPKGFNLITLKQATKKELLKEAGKADYFLVSGRLPIDKEVLKAAVNLKMIQRTGVGVDLLDLEEIKQKNIPVYVNQGVNSRSVAEHTLMLMLSVLRQLPLAHKNTSEGKWQRHELGLENNELYKKNIGLVGIGNIGRNVVRILQPFNVNIFYYKPNRLYQNIEKKLGITYLDFHQLLKKVDILSLHCPLNANTKKLIGDAEIALMKKGAIIINTSRGKVIDEKSLVKALKADYLKGAGIDVFEIEPTNQQSELVNLSNVVLTPHIGGVTYEAFYEMMSGAIKNIQYFEEGNLMLIKEKRLF